MKKTLFLLPLLCSVSINAFAKSYINVGYGVSSISTDENVVFVNTADAAQNVTLKPEKSDSIWNVTFGYDTGNNSSIEFTYTEFRADAELERAAGFSPAPNNFPQLDNFEANVKATQFSITPVYHRALNNKMVLKGGAGITYTNYEFSGHNYREILDVPQGGVPDFTNPSPRSAKKWGVNAIIGADYVLMDGLTIGVQGNISYDSIATQSSILGTIGFRF